MNTRPAKTRPDSITMLVIRVPCLRTPCFRSSRSPSTTGTLASASMWWKTASATCGSKPHMVSLSTRVFARLRYWSQGLPGPGIGLRVVAVNPPVELAGHAADGFLVADVGAAQAAGGQPAEVSARLDEHDAAAHARRLHGRGDAARGAAVDDHIHPPISAHTAGHTTEQKGQHVHKPVSPTTARNSDSLPGDTRLQSFRHNQGATEGDSPIFAVKEPVPVVAPIAPRKSGQSPGNAYAYSK